MVCGISEVCGFGSTLVWSCELKF